MESTTEGVQHCPALRRLDPGSGMLSVPFSKFQDYCILDLTVCNESVQARDSSSLGLWLGKQIDLH